MKQSKYEELSVEKLLKFEKLTKVASYSLLKMLIILLLFGIYISITKGFTPLVIIPLALSSIVFLNLSTLKKIQTEKKNRDYNQYQSQLSHVHFPNCFFFYSCCTAIAFSGNITQ